MGRTPFDEQSEAQSFRELPDPVRLEDTVPTQAAGDPPDPTSGRDPDTEWLLKYGAG